MIITPTILRMNFPEFADTATYTDTQIQFWLTLSASFLSPCVWVDENILDFATQLFAMHYLALFQKNLQAAAVGGIPGGASGVVSSKTVDKVSVAYNTTIATLEGGGQWNLTTYGVQLLQLARMFGMGAYQLMPSGTLAGLNGNFNPYLSGGG